MLLHGKGDMQEKGSSTAGCGRLGFPDQREIGGLGGNELCVEDPYNGMRSSKVQCLIDSTGSFTCNSF